jgi:2-keto-4-pentenoate hydratase
MICTFALNFQTRGFGILQGLVGHAVVRSRYEREGIGNNVLGDPRAALTWLVNEVTSLGIVLKQDELITTGTCAVPLEIEPGDHVTADFGALGSISIAVA